MPTTDSKFNGMNGGMTMQCKTPEDELNLLFYKYFSGQVSKTNQLSKQNELYIQHLLAQSQAYQQ